MPAKKKRKPREYKPLTAYDVSDENPRMLANRLDALAAEVRAGFELLGNRILVAVARVENSAADIAARVTVLERDRDRHTERLAALEARKEITP